MFFPAEDFRSPLLPIDIVLLSSTRHFLGLPHTFQGGCQDPGDGVSDTNPQSTSHWNQCTIGTDTCPGGGVDPIHNFLDYSSDECQYEFTAGQMDVMWANLHAYRTGEEPINLSSVNLTDGIQSDSYSLATNRFLVFQLHAIPSDSTISCETFADNGNLDLFLNFDGGFNLFVCESVSPISTEKCIVNNGNAPTLYLLVHASLATIDFTVKCCTGVQG